MLQLIPNKHPPRLGVGDTPPAAILPGPFRPQTPTTPLYDLSLVAM